MVKCSSSPNDKLPSNLALLVLPWHEVKAKRRALITKAIHIIARGGGHDAGVIRRFVAIVKQITNTSSLLPFRYVNSGIEDFADKAFDKRTVGHTVELAEPGVVFVRLESVHGGD